jgi:hypothetical protein
LAKIGRNLRALKDEIDQFPEFALPNIDRYANFIHILFFFYSYFTQHDRPDSAAVRDPFLFISLCSGSDRYSAQILPSDFVECATLLNGYMDQLLTAVNEQLKKKLPRPETSE